MPLENVRDFIVRTLLQDEASKGLDNLLAKAAALTEKSYTISVDIATTQAEKAIKSVEAATKAASNIDTSKATRGIKEQDRAVGGLGGRLNDFATQAGKAGDGIGSFFSKLDAGRLIAAGSAAGIAYLARHVVEIYENVKLYTDLIQAKVGTATGLMSFIESGGAESGTSRLGRAAATGYLTMTGWAGGDQPQIESLAAGAEKIMRRTQEGQYLKTLGIADETALLKALSEQIDPTSDLGKTLAPLAPELFQQSAVESEKILVQQEDKYSHIMPTQYGQAIIEQEARRRIAARAIESIGEKAAPRADTFGLAMEDMNESIRNLRENVGKYIEPTVITITKFLDAIIDLAARAPGITTFSVALASLGVILVGLATILPLVSLGVKALTAAMVANPIGLVIAAIAILIVALATLEAKFGVFSKAWEHFAQSEIGKDLIAGFNELLKSLGLVEGTDFMSGLGAGIEFITSRVATLYDMLDAVYKMAKGGDILGAMRGGMEVALRITPIGMALAITEGMMPQKRVQDLILWVLQKANDTWAGFIRWLQDIYDGIRGLLDPLVGIYNTVKGLYDKYFGNVPKTPEETQKRLIEALNKNIATQNERSTPEQKEWLARYAMGEENPMGMTAHEAGVSTHQVEAAREEYEKLMSGQSTAKPLISTPAAIQEADKKINEIAREGQEKADEAIANRDFLGFMANQYSMGAQVIGAMGGGLLDWITGGKKYATGGEVTKSGLAWVDEGEPIVPAEVARDSNLIDLLRGASEGGGGAGGNFTIQNLNVSVPAGSSDPYTFARQFRDALVNELDNPAVKAKIEQVYHRANRGYIG
ncbi:MAG: hypothetical protein WC343_02310 [Bacilli bacterium]|jgi:hypothetical protein